MSLATGLSLLQVVGFTPSVLMRWPLLVSPIYFDDGMMDTEDARAMQYAINFSCRILYSACIKKANYSYGSAIGCPVSKNRMRKPIEKCRLRNESYENISIILWLQCPNQYL